MTGKHEMFLRPQELRNFKYTKPQHWAKVGKVILCTTGIVKKKKCITCIFASKYLNNSTKKEKQFQRWNSWHLCKDLFFYTCQLLAVVSRFYANPQLFELCTTKLFDTITLVQNYSTPRNWYSHKPTKTNKTRGPATEVPCTTSPHSSAGKSAYGMVSCKSIELPFFYRHDYTELGSKSYSFHVTVPVHIQKSGSFQR